MAYIGIDAKKDIRLNATSDLDLTSDSTTIKFGADDDVTLTHVHNTGLLLNSTNQFQFGDSGTYIHQSADGVLDLVSDTEIEINATTIDMNGNVDISGTMNASGTIGAPKGVFTSSNAGQVSLNSTSSDYMLEFQTNGTSEWWIRSSAASWKVAENGVGDHLTILASNGNVGLGTSSPSHLLDLNASSTATLRFQTSANQRMKITNTSSASAIYSHNGNPLIFGTDSSTSDTEAMRIDSSGRVSIGNSSPVSPAGHNSRLAVEGTDYHGATISISANSANSNGAYLMFSKSRGTSVGSTTVVADSDTLGYIGFNAADGLDVSSISAAIYSQIDGSPGNNDTPGRIIFATTPDDAQAVTNRMFITSAGVKIMNNTTHGNITSGNSSGASFDSAGTLHSSRATTSNSLHWYLYNSNGHVGSISTNGSATQFNTSSDYRLKENVVTDWDATSRLKQLKPSRFNFKTDKDTTVDGFLAHEVSSIVPEAITGEKDATKKIKGVVLSSTGAVLSDNVKESEWVKGKTTYRDEIQKIDIAQLYPSDSTWVAEKDVPDYQSIDQSKLVPLLVKTIQELEARIAKLEGV